MPDSSQQSVLFEDVSSKLTHVRADAEGQSSDGGLVLLAAADRRLGLTKALSACIFDMRNPSRVVHSTEEVLRQRVFSIAAGYEDGNDATKLRYDPALTLAVGRSTSDGNALASQPSISRFENSVSPIDALVLGRKIEEVAIDQLKRQRPKGRRPRIVIDLDPSVDPAHGAQQGVLFHGGYGSWCYLPMFGFLSFEGEPSQLLFHARLRSGTSKEGHGTIPLLRRTVERLRQKFGARQKILVRLDGGFFAPRLLEELDRLKVHYVVGMPSNKRLKAIVAPLMPRVKEAALATEETTREFTECSYRTRSWRRARRVVTKVEAIPYPGRTVKENPRHFVTNLRAKPESVHALYCLRGDPENRIKELKAGLAVDRTSCSRFVANQVRVILAAAAYLLFQELRWRARRKLGRMQVPQLISRLIKVSATIIESTRRIVVRLPTHYPFRDEWFAAARALGASSG